MANEATGGLGGSKKSLSKGSSWITKAYRPQSFNTRAPTGPSRDRGPSSRDLGIAGGRRGEPKKPSPFAQAMDLVRNYWRQGAQGPNAFQSGSVPASMMGGFGPSNMAIGAAAIPAARPILNQPVPVTSLRDANLFDVSGGLQDLLNPEPKPYEYQPPSPEQALLQSPFYAPDVPITSYDEEGNQVPMLDENGEPVVIAAPEASPTVVPDTYAKQLQSWRRMMANFMGAGPRTLPDTWLGQQYRLWQQYNAPLEPVSDWWGGGGGGGWWGYPDYPDYGKQEYPWWLGMVNWKIQ